MPVVKSREEVLNVYLAERIGDSGLSAEAENIEIADGSRVMPDVIVSVQGLRCAIEGKWADVARARELVSGDARSRTQNGVAHLVVAVVYPPALREIPLSAKKQALHGAILDFRIFTEITDGDWQSGDIDTILDNLRRSTEILASDDVVTRSVLALEAGMSDLVNVVWANAAAAERVAGELGIHAPDGGDANPRARLQRLMTAARVASLTVANAMIFQAELGEVDSRIEKLRTSLLRPDPVGALLAQWTFVQENINYVPIFRLAALVATQLPERTEAVEAVRRLGEAVRGIVAERAALRHDLMGRIYHRLLHDAKYLGTFYTSVSAATLLLKLALSPERWVLDWSNVDEIRRLRVGDLASGTGTLLMAAQQALTDNFIHTSMRTMRPVDDLHLRRLHTAIMEDILYGYDVLPSAVHLTASTLALLAPEVAFGTMHLYCMPMGAQPSGNVALGSIEYLASDALPITLDLMGADSAMQVTGSGDMTTNAELPKLDLCVMNPPFVRSVGGNLLFGSMPDKDRKLMQQKLQALLKPTRGRGVSILANSTAGLGSIFAAIGDRHLKDDGTIALVLPQALAFGAAWKKTRQLFDERYALEYVIVSHDPNRWNFSENTELSEILVIGKRRPASGMTSERVTFVNLWRNATTIVDALALADAIKKCPPAAVGGLGAGIASVRTGDVKRGEAIQISRDAILGKQWYPCAFAQTDMVRVCHGLRGGRWTVPGTTTDAVIPLARLRTIADLGPDRRDIKDCFEDVQHATPYPALWSHDADSMNMLHAAANRYLEPLNAARTGRNLRTVQQLWPKAGRVMLVETLWAVTQSVVAVRLAEYSLANVWFPLRLRVDDPEAEKALTVWLNSTAGITMLLSYRVPTRGSWMHFKKEVYEEMPVLDVTKITDAEKKFLSGVYDEAATQALRPFRDMGADPVRRIIDAGLSSILGLPAADDVREMLAREPIICGEII